MVIVIDDANYPDVRQATYDFLMAFPEFKLVFDAYTSGHPSNLDAEELKRNEQGWLNGINILVRDTENRLPVMLPPVTAQKTLYFNEWLVHRHQLAELAPEALDLAQAMLLSMTERIPDTRRLLEEKFAASKSQFLNEKYPEICSAVTLPGPE